MGIDTQNKKSLMGVDTQNKLTLQNNKYDFNRELLSRASAAMKHAGLPEYALYTGGVMPTRTTYLPGNNYKVQIPFGASKDWVRPVDY